MAPLTQDKLFTVTYRHFRVYRDHEMHHKGGVTLALGYTADGKVVHVAAAVCSDDEMYSHVEGRKRAYNRLMEGGKTVRRNVPGKPEGVPGLTIPVQSFLRRPTPAELTDVATKARKLTRSRGGRLIGKGQWGQVVGWAV